MLYLGHYPEWLFCCCLSLVILNSDKEKKSAPAGLDLEIWSPFCLGLSIVVYLPFPSAELGLIIDANFEAPIFLR